MRFVSLILGVVAVLLGGLWLLQGLGVVHIEPVACIAECEALEGPSIVWAAIGFAVFLAGVAAIWYGMRRRVSR